MGFAERMKLIRFPTRSVESWPPTSFASRKRHSSRGANARPHLQDQAGPSTVNTRKSETFDVSVPCLLKKVTSSVVLLRRLGVLVGPALDFVTTVSRKRVCTSTRLHG